MVKLKKNKAQGHIEMILSFVIFTGFVLAIFVFLTPVRQNMVSYASLEKTQTSLLSNATINYDYVSVILNVSGPLCIDNPFLGTNIFVKDSNGNHINSQLTAENNIYASNSGDRYYKIYYSSFFDSKIPGSSCNALAENIDYTKVVVSSGKDVLYDNIGILEDAYVTDYNKLKLNLGLTNDFEFVVYNFSYGVLMNRTLSVHPIKSSSVLSRDIPVRALTKTGAYRDLIMTVRAW